ncbi:Oidioi.mRNA.OKI2018_I69.PAR.g10495.t1.cds [Oikopleura dioica]|uniref:Oidioi.mRNA.OKI2018_I69.PAR.g10495.t1.cds n=1 Tax=Oikopleura dioica TaxID=34765 RepID=A0ABN7RW34_OIKDI|nr:Oidioi.mRNA.OKI2018_I69.PAR.g10495.t1.cds [Oikopleura dioica]
MAIEGEDLSKTALHVKKALVRAKQKYGQPFIAAIAVIIHEVSPGMAKYLREAERVGWKDVPVDFGDLVQKLQEKYMQTIRKRSKMNDFMKVKLQEKYETAKSELNPKKTKKELEEILTADDVDFVGNYIEGVLGQKESGSQDISKSALAVTKSLHRAKAKFGNEFTETIAAILHAISPATAKYLRQAEGNKWRDVTRPQFDFDNYDQNNQNYEKAVTEMQEPVKAKLQEKYAHASRVIDEAVDETGDFQVFYEKLVFI